MMNADKGVIYKGLPQDEWESKPTIARIISTGPTPPNNPSGNNTAKKSFTKVFLMSVFFLCILTVLGVISFRIYEAPTKGFFDFWGDTNGKPNNQTFPSTSSSETMGNQNTTLQSISTNEETGYEGNHTQSPSFTSSPLTDQTTQLDNSSITNTNTPFGVGGENETTTKEFPPESSKLTNNSFLRNESSMLSKILREYFNGSSPREEQIREWLEHLISKPSIEVTIIAAGIIFAGVSLLIIGVVCIIGQNNRRRRRRHRLNRKAKEGNRIEKVILLADDASEDEFTKK